MENKKTKITNKSERTKTHVTFVCQKCAQPIKLNRSMMAKNLVTLAQEAEQKFRLEWSGDQAQLPNTSPEAAIPTTSAVVSETEPDIVPVSRERSSPTVVAKRRRSSLDTMSVILAPGHPDKKSTLKQIEIASDTLKILSAHTDVDHPLCEECPESILDSYDVEIRKAEQAQQHYDKMTHRLESEVKGYRSQMSELDAELEKLRKEEELLKAKLLKSEEQRTKTASEMEQQRRRESNLRDEEQAYWKDFNEHQQQMLQFKDDQLSVQYQLHYTTDQLSRLKKTNVLNSAFNIWHNGHFGTINGLRLGRLQTVPVEWSEINAAWGQTAFLLSTLARLTGVKFERYQLVPYGNQSFLEAIDGKRKILPLHSSAGLRILTDSKFDSAMVAFLDCLNQLKHHIENNSHPHFMLPYQIDKEKIGDVGKESYSIKTQFNTQERWTKALKFVLTNLRWALTWVAANSIQNTAD